MRLALALTFLTLSTAARATEWIARTDAELSEVLSQTCASAKAASKPVLVEFSATWCGDCQLLGKLKEREPLKSELETVSMVVVDVGRFDRHKDLLSTFQIGAIAHWLLLRPDDCTKPVTEWTVLKGGTLEPKSGTGPATAEGIAAWLREGKAVQR